MKNKIELKKCIFAIGVAAILFSALAGVIHYHEYAAYQREYNGVLGQLLLKIQKNYPDVTEQELIKVLNGKGGENQSDNLNNEEIKLVESMLQKYGIDFEKDSLLLKNKQHSVRYLFAWILFCLGLTGCVCFLFLRYNGKKDKELDSITKYIEEINRKNYALKMDSMSEDELSMLKTEIYKTTIMLKEAAENSKRDKENLKDALADISHQMKTPLTSILVILDNLIDDPDMEMEVRQDFVMDVKREIGHLQFLVQVLLKMTKLDAGTVTFFREKTSLKNICVEVIRNVEVLCDLKNIQIQVDYLDDKKDDKIYCDFRWQVEAVTNILKNCVEHAPNGSTVIVKVQKNQVYGSISITDFGPGIDQEDMKHLFERFYRGKSSSAEGVGIGLSLAKSIVENDNGRIFVESSEEKTIFTIKYFL